MDNYKRTVELVEIAQNSEGRSSQQFEKYAESLEYKLKRLRNTWEQFRISIASSSFFKGLVDNANKLLSVISKFDAVDWGKALLLFTTIGRKAASNFLKGWRDTFSNFRSLEPKQLKTADDSGRIKFFGSWLKTGVTKKEREELHAREITANNIANNKEAVEEAKKWSEDELEEYRAKIQKRANAWSSSIGASASMAFTTAFSAYMLANNPGEVFKTVMISGATTAASSVANIFSAQLASGAGLKASLAQGFKGGLVSIGISAAIAAAFTGIKALSNYFEKEGERIARSTSAFYDAARALEDLKKKEEELNKTLSERKGLLEDSEKSYKELMKQGESLTELSKKTLLSTEEQEEYIKLSNEIVEQYPELLSYYDAEGNAIVNLGDAYEKLIEKKKESYLLDKQQVAESSYDLALTQYSQAVESQKKAENLGTEKGKALTTLMSLGSLTGPDWIPLSPGTRADAKTAEAYFKEVLSENSLFNSAKEGKEYLEFLEDFLENEETAEEFFKTIEDYENSHLKKDFTKEIQTAQNNLITKAQEYLVSQLEGTQYYQNITDVNAQRAMVRAILENANYSLDALKDEFEKTVDTEGLNSTQIDKAFSDFMQEKLSSIDLDEDKLAGIFSEETANAWHRITLAVGKDATFDQYARAVFNSDLDPDEKRRWAQENIDTILTTNDQKKTLAGALGESLTDLDYGEGIILKQFAEGTFGRQIEDLGQVGYNKFVDGFEKASTGGTEIRDQYVDSVRQLMTELGPENFKVLMSQDWDSYTKVNAEQFWKSMEEQFTGDYSTDFKTKYQKLIEDIFTNPNISSENLFEQITNNFDVIESNIQAYAKAIKSSAENGYIDASALKALYKAGAPIEKMVNDDSTINKEEADKWIKEQLLSEEQIVELLKDQETQRINQLRSLEKQLEGEHRISQELAYQVALTETKNISQADALAKQYGGLNQDEFISEIEKEIAIREKGLSDEAKLYKIAQGYVKASWGSYYDANQDYQDSLEKTTSKVKDNTKAITDAYDTILEKQQDLIDKQKKLNDVLYGTSTRKTSLDVLYNYKTALDSLNKEIERAKDVLDDLDGKSPAEYLNTIVSGTHGRAAYLTAQNEVNQKAINRTLSDLNQQLGNWLINNGYNINPTSFIKETSLGYFINQEALNQAQMNDDLKKLIEEQVESLNNLRNNIFDNNEAIRKEQKEFVEYQRKIRDQYLSIEDEIVKKLEEYYKQQIEDKKNMYDALSEADSDYLNALEKAINKQKELRDRQDKWNSLAEKEKKYSLLARDTSGAGQRDLLKLQQDIQKDRTGLLDESVNSVVNDLKELYDLQKETREDEIKYQESLLENSNLIQEANAIMQSWKSIDDLMSWMYEHTEGIENMSDAAIEKLSDDWKTMFDNIQVYNELQQTEISDMFNFTAQEIQQIVIGTSEALTGESSRAIVEVTANVEQSIKDAQDAVTEAMKALTEAQNKYNEAIAEFNQQSNILLGKLIEHTNDSEHGEGFNYTYTKPENEVQLSPNEQLYLTTKSHSIANEDMYVGGSSLSFASVLLRLDQEGRLILGDRSSGLLGGGDFTSKEAEWLFKKLPEYGYNIVNTNGTYYAITNDKLNAWMTSNKGTAKIVAEGKKYASGGLVNYTGPAWVDGSSTKPEAFLSAEDTARIGEAANIFKEIAALGNNGTLSSGLSSTNNNNVELHIHVDSIATEAQVDYLIDRMKQELVDAASPIGTNIIF